MGDQVAGVFRNLFNFVPDERIKTRPILDLIRGALIIISSSVIISTTSSSQGYDVAIRLERWSGRHHRRTLKREHDRSYLLLLLSFPWEW